MVKKVKNNSISATKNNPVTFTQSITSGPIPSPDILSKYDALMPGLADRIVTMAEVEVSQRHKVEWECLVLNREALHVEAGERRIGQILGFSIGMASLAVSIVSLFMRYEIAASIIGGTTVVGLVAVFVTGRFKKDTSTDPQAPESQ